MDGSSPLRDRPLRDWAVPAAVLALTAAGVAMALGSGGYTAFVLALVALTGTVGVGLNVLVGLTGQVSLGHVGFYAIGAYTTAVLGVNGVPFWVAWPLAGALAAAIGLVLALPALRVSGPYLAMVTIAFAFIVHSVAIEWRPVTGGANGLMGIEAPTLGGAPLTEGGMAALAVLLFGGCLWLFHRLAESPWGKAMLAVRDAEVAARSIGLDPTVVKTVAFAVSAACAGLAGGVFAPLMLFVAPDSFPFSQSILFLLAVIVGGAGWTFGPVVGAVVAVVLPELLAGMAEYRLLFFGALLLAVLWVAPQGAVGTLARLLPRRADRAPAAGGADVASFLRPDGAPAALEVAGIGISFGGVRAASDVSFTARPGAVTSVIGPNGAGKTTVLNMVGGFYRPDTGSVRLGGVDLAGRSAWAAARGGIARTYQTTQLFGTLGVLDNVLIAMRRGRLGNPLARRGTAAERATAEALLAFVGYRGGLDVAAEGLAHVDRRLVEIARALATRPRVLLLDEPAAGLMRADKDALSTLIRCIADLGIAVVLVEHDMALVMAISDRVVVLDAGTGIADGLPAEVRRDPRVLKAYLGDGSGGVRARPRAVPWAGSMDAVLTTLRLTAGYGAAPVLEGVDLTVRPGELVAVLGANGAGKSTAMRALAGLLRPVEGNVVLDDAPIAGLPAHAIARRGLALVPEGRQVFPELTVLDNIRLGAFTRGAGDRGDEIAAVLERFPRLKDRLDSRAGLLSGGEQQMVAIARGLLARPRILLLDEPSLGLAPAMVNELYDVLATLRDEGTTILLVDQMANLALTVADRGYVLESGRIVASGAAAELVHDQALEAAYLGHAEAVE